MRRFLGSRWREGLTAYEVVEVDANAIAFAKGPSLGDAKGTVDMNGFILLEYLNLGGG